MAESKLQSLVEIFNQKFFRIPDYQRGYSWEEEQLDDFWVDLENLKPNKFHYTGLLTVESIEKKNIERLEKWHDDLWMFDKGLKAYYIIDGQQRLTTIIILLKVIIDKFDESEGINFEPRNTWITRFLYQQYGQYKSYVFGYEKDNPSDEFFKTKILNQVSLSSAHVPEQTLYTMNLKYAKEYFEKKVKKLKKQELENVFKKVVNFLKFNFYEIDNDLDVFVTFETLNNRGKILSKLELLKNRLIYLTTILPNNESDKNRLRNDINSAWKTIYEYLGKNKDNPLNDDEFLLNHWIMSFKYDRSESEVYAKFLLKEYFTVNNISVQSPRNENDFDPIVELFEFELDKIDFDVIKTYTESISKSVMKWFYIHNPAYSKFNDDVKEYLEKLNRLSFGAFRPIIMCAMFKEVDEEKLLRLLKNAERFNFLVFRLSKRPSNTQSSNLYRTANDFYSDDLSIDKVNKNIEELIDGDDEYDGWFDIEGFKNQINDLYKKGEGFYSWSGLNYFLYEYELFLMSKARGNAKVKWEDINHESIEHVYPQEAYKDCWKKSFNGFSSKERGLLLNSLGNFLLLSQSKNSEFQNECFEFKKEHEDKKGNQVGYFNGSYSEIDVTKYNDWTPNLILKRGIKMLDFVEERWDIEIGNDKDKAELLLLEFIK
ncbi:MAG: DUF262 domain-containing HNH endonuclease family protein [Candidatus Methanoperedens sp.]|nr:DUF262 domain-containing HNH endonuclease family protein [Candidatus Methanoperedens sp.]